MIIGIISDTHNDMEMTRRAVDIFRERGVDMVIHAGDITSPKMLQLFSGLDARFVLGNEDLDVLASAESLPTLATAAAAFDSDDMPANFRLVEHPADS